MERKRKKQYYANAAKKGKYGSSRKLCENMRGFLITVNNRFIHKALAYVEYRAVSGVVQKNLPPPPNPPREWFLPPHQRGSNTSRAGAGGGGEYFGRSP